MSESRILVNERQKGNQALSFIKNVGWEYADIVPDFQVGRTSCALFLSLRYHRLHPEYIYTRVKSLQNKYELRIILCLVDANDFETELTELTTMAFANDFTVIICFSYGEAGRYLETLKAYEYKAPDAIMEKPDSDHMSLITETLTSIKSINKTDVVTLTSSFGSLHGIMKASSEQLMACPGFAEQKINRLQSAFNEPFILSKGTN